MLQELNHLEILEVNGGTTTQPGSAMSHVVGLSLAMWSFAAGFVDGLASGVSDAREAQK